MAVIELPQYRPAFDASRLRLLDRGTHTLVMDRVSGHWLTIESESVPLVQLVATRDELLPESVRVPVADLRALLLEHGVGATGGERHFGGLNTVILKLTNACNLACSYCYDFESFERATVLPVEMATRALDEALELVESELWVILHGGEPMLLWDTIEAIVLDGERLSDKHGKRINFVGQTNLSRLNDRVVGFSTEHAIAWGVSVDGAPEIHDHFRVTRGGGGSYELFEQALERYPEFVRGLGVMSTITKINQDKLLSCARHFRDLGMAAWDWSLFQPIGRGRSGAIRFALDTDVLVDSWDELYGAVEQGEFDGFPVLPVKKYLDNFIAGPGGNMCMRGECGAGRDLLSVSADGVVEACDCIDPTGPLSGLGDLKTSTLAAARESPVAEAIRARDLSHAPCADCIWFGVCGGTCLAHAPSLNEVWADGCALAMRAFDRISGSLVRSDRLVRYMQSVA